jgi:hypothetical protein
MIRTALTAVLFAAFAIPAYAGDPVLKNSGSDATPTIDQSTTASTTGGQSDAMPMVTQGKNDGGCMRKNTVVNMM